MNYIECQRCVMDTTAKNIAFNAAGHCNFCEDFLSKEKAIFVDKNVNELISRIKLNGKREYNCVVGLSGGVDSAYTLVKVIELGLRPLVVHMDNGWNSELAQSNIENLINSLGVDLYTHVIEWDVYRDMMQALFAADVVDVEILYDNAMLGACYKAAKKFNVKHILSGSNYLTEGMKMPDEWNWYKRDVKNIKGICKKQNVRNFKSFPFHSSINRVVDELIYGIKWIPFLDYIPYNKEDALIELEQNYKYRRYPYKHYESIFTRFYQGYILPKKFNIDKRRIHLSNLIITNQISRKVAKQLLNNEPYELEDLLEDREYFLKKMGWSEKKLNDYLDREPKSHYSYPNERSSWERFKRNVDCIKAKLNKSDIK
ncbi:hypothetical protein pfor_22c2451 [Rhodobacteraceae bacterium SB2]|nr:hypothetical protein pfor_22c2451 [Rhodobacteraceae bacterium SB2]